METIDEVELIKKLTKWERGSLAAPSKKIEENEDDDHSCQKLEVELLVAENKQLRAQVALLAHEKDTALAMWRNERQKNQALSRLLVRQRNRTGQTEKEVAGGSEEQEEGETWLSEGALPPFDLHAGLAIVADHHRTRDEDEDRCLPTSSGRAALQVRGETSRPPTLPLKRKYESAPSVTNGVRKVALAPVPSSPYCSAERKPPPVGGEEGSESQPLVSKRERRRKELFPQQQLSLSPFPNESKIAEAKRRKVEAAPSSTATTVTRGRRGEKLQESRIPTPSLRPKAKPEATTPQRTPGASASADTTPEGEAATGPKDYSCRDCKRKFCRRGDRDNHELLCGHTKWRNGQTLALGFVELD